MESPGRSTGCEKGISCKQTDEIGSCDPDKTGMTQGLSGAGKMDRRNRGTGELCCQGGSGTGSIDELRQLCGLDDHRLGSEWRGTEEAKGEEKESHTTLDD